jgi:hypothetical protein
MSIDNPTGTFYNPESQQWEQSFMFGEISDEPNFIDGKKDSVYVDLNGAYYRAVINDWNERVEFLSAYLGKTAVIGERGSNRTSLLTYTRYDGLTNIDLSSLTKTKLAKLPKKYRDYFEAMQKHQEEQKKTKIERTKSLKKDDAKMDAPRYPPGSTLMNVENTHISSFHEISSAMRGYFPFIILPQVTVTSVPFSFDEIRVETQEVHAITTNVQGDTITTVSTRFMELQNLGRAMAPGIASGDGKTEVDVMYTNLIAQRAGGFIGDVITGIGQVASMFGV